VSLPDGEDFIMRPVLRGLCKLESLVDGTLTLEDIARANEALNVYDENERRFHEWNERQQQQRG
jgi:hypothetical protein